MKNLLTAILILFQFALIGQSINPAMHGEITDWAVVDSVTYLVTISVSDESGIGNGTMVDETTWVMWQSCKRYDITSISCGSCELFSDEITVEITDSYGTLGFPEFGFVNVLKETSNGVGAYVSESLSGLQQCMLQYYAFVIGDLLATPFLPFIEGTEITDSDLFYIDDSTHTAMDVKKFMGDYAVTIVPVPTVVAGDLVTFESGSIQKAYNTESAPYDSAAQWVVHSVIDSFITVCNHCAVSSFSHGYSIGDILYEGDDGAVTNSPTSNKRAVGIIGPDTVAYFNINEKVLQSFDSDRPVLRVPSPGDNIGGATITDWINWWYFVAPSITLNGITSVYEVGTVNSITLSGATTNNGGATLSNGDLRETTSSTVINAFGAATSYTSNISFEPQQGGAGLYNEFTYTFQAKQDWSGAGESGTISSPNRIIYGVYPVLHGMSAVDLSAGGDPYTELTKLVQNEGDKTITFTGTNEYMYYAIPKTWVDYDLFQIIDHNGFNVTSSFTAYDITVTSSGLTNNWTNEPYKLYKLNTLTSASGFDYQFIR